MIIVDNEIAERIIRVLKKCAAIPEELLESSNWQKPLTGKDYRLSAADLVYVLFELEDEFSIRIPSEDLGGYRFSTVEGIYSIVQAQLNH